MDLQSLRQRAKDTLRQHQLTQESFTRRHDVPLSWFAKFISGAITNPRYSSIKKLEGALDDEAAGRVIDPARGSKSRRVA